MTVFVPPLERPLRVRGTVIRPDETPEQYLQKLARITLDEMSQLVGVLTTDGVLLECNRAALVAGGLTREEVIGKPFWETFWWTVTPKTQSDLRQAIALCASGEFVRYDVEVHGRKGGTETVIMDFTLLPVRDEGGRVVFLLPEGRDITEKKAHEREIARQREEIAQLQQLTAQLMEREASTSRETSALWSTLEAERSRQLMLFENAPALICQVRGPNHVFEIANPHFRRFTGNRKLIGLSVREAFPEIEGQGYFELLDHVYRTGQSHLANESPAMVDLDGDGRLQEQFVSYIFYPSRAASGDVDGVLVLGVDVTEHVTARRRAEEERRIAEAARAKAESAVRVRDEFLSVASHELRTPLTTLGLQVDGLLQALSRAGAESDARWVQKAERVRDQADRLEQLVEGMIDVFSLGRERVELVCEDVDLAELTRGVIERILPQSKRARAPIELMARPVVGHWDPKRLEQVVFQLLSNALKFGANGSVQVNVSGSASAATLSVVDHGIGIAPEHHERVFGRFERASSASNYGGFGLGLWVVRELVSAMRGNVKVHSECGRGSTFTIELPRRP